MDELALLAQYLRERNEIDNRIASIIGRPALPGHIGEFIAANVFDISLMENTTQKGYDGHFASGPLKGRTVNVKLYGKQEGILDIHPDMTPDFFLVLTGPKTAAAFSRGTSRPFAIDHVYLFEARGLVSNLKLADVKIGVSTSVKAKLWEEAEIYPEQRNKIYLLTEKQRSLLKLFELTTM